MQRQIMREKDGRFVRAEIKLENGRLSICGTEGHVLSRSAAKKEALAYWEGFFDDNKDEWKDMEQRFDKHFRTAKAAAQFVLDSDGEFHGLDVTATDGDKVYVIESCGQIVDTLREWFPELAPALPWHLNDMKAGCGHQEALGWGHGKDIALTRDTATEAQLKELDGDLVLKKFNELMGEVKRDPVARRRILAAALGQDGLTIDDAAASEHVGTPIGNVPWPHRDRVHQLANALNAYAAKTAEKFRSAIFNDSLCAPCPTCGYKYGTAWLKRELPAEIVHLVTEFNG